MNKADNTALAEKSEGARHSKLSLRLWLKLLSSSKIVEKRLRARLEEEFASTLPRFDTLAALEHHPEGLKMSELSESLLVSNGNVTGVVIRLIKDGFVTRTVDSSDRRAATVRLTRKGREAFLKMAASHETWIHDMFANLSDNQIAELTRLVDYMRRSIEADAP